MSAGKRGPLPKPRYRGGAVDRWEVKVEGKYRPILDEFGNFIRGDTRDGEVKATACWHQMVQRQQARARGGDNTVAVVLDIYLDEVQRLHPSRYAAEARTFQSFVELFPNLTVNELTERHVDEWFAAHPEWKSPSTRMTRLASLCAAFNWASQGRDGQRLIPYDHPLRGLDRGRLQNKAYHRRRGSGARVEEQIHIFLMHNVADDFRQVLFALRHTGTRPGNVCKVTAQHLNEERGVWLFEEDNTSAGDTVHKTYDVTHEAVEVPLTEGLVQLCKQLREKHPTGPLFRRASGEPWTAQAIAERFRHYRQHFRAMGVPIPAVCFAYCYRHETATTLIAGGETDAMAAAVIGHQGTRTLHKHYNHSLAKAQERVNALRRHVRPLPGEELVVRGGAEAPARAPDSASPQSVELAPAVGAERD